MSVLHVIAPRDGSSSHALVGLMKLAMQRLPQSHHLLVLGDAEDASSFRSQGVSVLGAVQGQVNRSRTLGARMQRTVRAITTKKDTMIAWGWDAATSISGINSVHKTIAYVDAIETGSMPTLAIDRIIPTTWTHAKHLNQKNKSSHIVTEPLVGIHSNTLVVDRASVYQGLGVQASSPIVTTLNNRGDWKQLVAFLVQMRSLGEEVILVIPNEYDWYSELYFALEEHGLEHALRQVTTGLRLIDIVHSSAIAWAPTSTVKGSVEGILDVLNAAASGIPTVTSFDHPIAGLPTVGSRIAQVTSSIEFCAWVKALLQTPQKESDLALELGARIRSIASPSRFVEGLQLRLQ